VTGSGMHGEVAARPELKERHMRLRARCSQLFLILTPLGFLLPACDPESHLEYIPIQIQFIDFPDTLAAGVSDTLHLGAYVGYDRCELQSLRLRARRDSLRIEGTARCRVTEGLESPPAIVNGRWLDLDLPALTPGRYFLVGSDLVDTVVVVPAASREPHRRIAAHGTLSPHPSAACGSDAWSYEPALYGWVPGLGRAYLLHGSMPMPDPWPNDWELHANVAGPPSCQLDFFTAELRLRSFRVH
jgi:hypothetical protein